MLDQNQQTIAGGKNLKIHLDAQLGIRNMQAGDQQINLLDACSVEGNHNGIYLKENGVVWSVTSGRGQRVKVGKDHVAYEGQHRDLKTEVKCQLHETENRWVWSVRIENLSSDARSISLAYVQDLGLASRGAVRTNESYIGQYIDHQIVDTEGNGKVIMSRQNLAQSGAHPWMMSYGEKAELEAMSDGLDFFGADYRSHRGFAWANMTNGSQLRHGEHSMQGLVLEGQELQGKGELQTQFFSLLVEDHPEASSTEDLKLVEHWAVKASAAELVRDMDAHSTPLFQAESLNPLDIKSMYEGESSHMETSGDQVLSFFMDEGRRHVVLKEKELQSDRPHAHIVRSGSDLGPEGQQLSVTTHMAGGFMSHLCQGNSTFHKVLPVLRGHQFPSASKGLRIYFKVDGLYQQAGIPSAYEIYPQATTWLYKTSEGICRIHVYSSAMEESIQLQVINTSKAIESVKVEMDMIFGSDDEHLAKIEAWKNGYVIQSHESSLAHRRLMLSAYGADETETLCMDHDGQQGLSLESTANFTLKASSTESTNIETLSEVLEVSVWKAADQRLKFKVEKEEGQRLRDIVPWFTHNALIHYSSPHGIEQYGGAAWGVRDVCQGPMELFSSLDHPHEMKDILISLFGAQYKEGYWPQWYMFDEYKDMRQDHHHGDVVVWPLKAVLDYIEMSDDLSILQQKIPYHDAPEETLWEHLHTLLNHVEDQFIPGTHLISYGDGDWNDSLQPADPSMKSKMASTWTVQLLYQTLTRYETLLERLPSQDGLQKIKHWREQMKQDFRTYHIKDGVLAGFVRLDDLNQPIHLLHPSDITTGIHYRLLPINRGILSELLEPEEVERHLTLAKEHLIGPDGARLMDKPPKYSGGCSHHFQRAETASNFGREIGLMYVHAHIRYAEALARVGRADDLLKALLQVVPISLDKSVGKTALRQSNAYFSSSDADFSSRKDAEESYAELMKGEVQVKGGWRIYSSGPGIYLNVLKAYFYGLRVHYDRIVIDPVLPESFHGSRVETHLAGRKWEVEYQLTDSNRPIQRLELNGQVLDAEEWKNPYRHGGLSFSKAILDQYSEDEVLKLKVIK